MDYKTDCFISLWSIQSNHFLIPNSYSSHSNLFFSKSNVRGKQIINLLCVFFLLFILIEVNPEGVILMIQLTRESFVLVIAPTEEKNVNSFWVVYNITVFT